MKTTSTFLGICFGLALLAVFLTGTYYLFEYLASLYGTLEPQPKSMVIIATIVAFFCAAIIASGLKAGSPASISAAREDIYQQLLVHWSEWLKSATSEIGRAHV